MKILVLNGSPKGTLSGTLQYVHFLEHVFEEHEFQIIHVCSERDKIEQDEAALERILESVRAADGVLWVFPIYTFLVHSDYKRFIELVCQRHADGAFAGKYTATLSTSIHFFDHTAHNYIQAICDDWSMKYVGAFSAGVYDLVEAPHQQRLRLFGRGFLEAIENRMPTEKIHPAVDYTIGEYVPSGANGRVDLGEKRAIILTDGQECGANLQRMVTRLAESLCGSVEVIDLAALSIRFGCDGCFQCGADGLCVHRHADDLHELYISKLMPADVVVMAGSIRDRYLSWRWKLFFDRGFFRPLVPWLPGKQLAFLVSGPLKQIPNLRQILEGYGEYHQANLVGIVTDECDRSSQIDSLLDDLAGRLAWCARRDYVKPQSFLGVGGMKIFRDEAFGMLRPVFQPAHAYFKKHGLYDFPHAKLKQRLIVFLGSILTKTPGFRGKFFSSLKTEMIRPLVKAVEREGRQQAKRRKGTESK